MEIDQRKQKEIEHYDQQAEKVLKHPSQNGTKGDFEGFDPVTSGLKWIIKNEKKSND